MPQPVRLDISSDIWIVVGTVFGGKKWWLPILYYGRFFVTLQATKQTMNNGLSTAKRS